MTTIEMTTEFDYFTVERGKIVEALVADGYACDVTERVRRAIQRIAESISGDPDHDHDNLWISSGNYSESIRRYIRASIREGEYGGLPREGSLQFDSFASEDLGRYWVIDLHHKNVDRGDAFKYRYLVLVMEGFIIGNVTLAFTCEDMETIEEVIQPSTADITCPNPDCQGYLRCSDGYSLRTEQDFRYEPEAGEYDAEGIYCPFCTLYATGYRFIGPMSMTVGGNQGDAFFVPQPADLWEDSAVTEPFHLRATFHACE